MKKVTIPIEGGQHPIIPHKMFSLYKELYSLIQNKTDLSMFFPIKGDKYGKSSVRIMVVGRCVNGWHGMPKTTDEEFALLAADKILNANGFDWINKDDHISVYKNQKGENEEYNINRSAFWRIIKNVISKAKPWIDEYKRLGYKLSPSEAEALEKNLPCWFENIVWTNMYPVAPLSGGNVSEKTKKLIKNISADLLLEQIRFYKPSHIIFITDWDYWFADFAGNFLGVKKVSNDKTDNIVGLGEIEGIKTVVTRRPETRNNENMAEEIFKKIF